MWIRALKKWFILCIIVGGLQGCTILKSGKPNLPRIYNHTEAPRPTAKRPVIVIPGVLGSRLVNRKTGEVAWPKFTGTTSEWLALPILSKRLEENRDDLIATEIVDRARFFKLSPEISFYDSLLTALEQAGGYKHATFEAPPVDGDRDCYYVFAYDWRRDNVESARLLLQKIEQLKATLKRPDLQFDLVAHSMGGLIARYALMYGTQDLAPQDVFTPDWSGSAHVARLFMFGTPNSGSMDALSTLINGYSVLGTNLPQLKLLSALDRDAIFSMPSAYQLLPHSGYAKFYQEDLRPLAVNLYDIAQWRKYRWTIAFDERFRERELKRYTAQRKKLKKQKSPAAESKLGELEAAMQQMLAAREPFLQTVLERARQFHLALNQPGNMPANVSYYLFGGDCDATLQAAVVLEKNGVYTTFFRVKRAMGNGALREQAATLMFAPGDGRVTRNSLFGMRQLADQTVYSSVLPSPAQTIFHCEAHGDLPLNATLQDNLMAVLFGNKF